MRATSDADRVVLRRALQEKTTDLSTVLGRGIAFGEVASALLAGFEQAWSVNLVPGHLSTDESEAVAELANEYRTRP
jgi:hypothetical protein